MNHIISDKFIFTFRDRKTQVSFKMYPVDNRIQTIEHDIFENIQDIRIITECQPEQPTLPYPNQFNSFETLEICLAQVSAIESHYGCQVPEYARLVRSLLLNLYLLLNHFNFFTSLAETIQLPKLLEKSLIGSQMVQSLLSDISRHKTFDKLFVIGGITADLPTGFIENLQLTIINFEKIRKYIERRLSHRSLFSDLLENIGIVNTEKAATIGFSGPNYHASSPQSEYTPDIDKYLPISIQRSPVKVDFSKGTIGDAWHRTWLRQLEIGHAIDSIINISAALLKTDIKLVVQPHFSDRDSEFSASYSGVEGIIDSKIVKSSHHYDFSGKHRHSILNVLRHLESILKDARLSSAKITLASLNLNPLINHLPR